MPYSKEIIAETTEAILDPKTGMWLRPATTDPQTPGLLNDYKELGIKEGETVLDGGGNIGFFVWWAMRNFNPGRVVTIEPDQTNYGLLNRNVAQWGSSVIPINAAISRESCVKLFINPYRGKDSHTTIPTRGRQFIEVPGVGLDVLLSHYKPTRIKLDIEGEEHAWLPSMAFPDHVLGLTAEIHLQKKGTRESGKLICDNLQSQGFTMVRPYRDTGKNWHCVGTWRRD